MRFYGERDFQVNLSSNSYVERVSFGTHTRLSEHSDTFIFGVLSFDASLWRVEWIINDVALDVITMYRILVVCVMSRLFNVCRWLERCHRCGLTAAEIRFSLTPVSFRKKLCMSIRENTETLPRSNAYMFRGFLSWCSILSFSSFFQSKNILQKWHKLS